MRRQHRCGGCSTAWRGARQYRVRSSYCPWSTRSPLAAQRCDVLFSLDSYCFEAKAALKAPVCASLCVPQELHCCSLCAIPPWLATSAMAAAAATKPTSAAPQKTLGLRLYEQIAARSALVMPHASSRALMSNLPTCRALNCRSSSVDLCLAENPDMRVGRTDVHEQPAAGAAATCCAISVSVDDCSARAVLVGLPAALHIGVHLCTALTL